MVRIRDVGTESVDLHLDRSFRISRGHTDTTTNYLVTITDSEGTTGVGGIAPSPYYGETTESAGAVLPTVADHLEGHPIDDVGVIERVLEDCTPGENAARAGVSIAIYDLLARRNRKPLYARWDLDPEICPRISVTVGIDDPDQMATRAREWVQSGYPILKVKLGTDEDRNRLKAVRDAAPDASIRVDANEAWSVQETIDRLPLLSETDVALLEQPIPADDVSGLNRIRQATSIPIAADESCVNVADVARVGDAVDVIVVKLMKCGGIGPALDQIERARSIGCDVMVGCMVETSASIAGACHLAPLARYADLDGALLLANDPCCGPSLDDGEITLADVDAGTGAQC